MTSMMTRGWVCKAVLAVALAGCAMEHGAEQPAASEAADSGIVHRSPCTCDDGRTIRCDGLTVVCSTESECRDFEDGPACCRSDDPGRCGRVVWPWYCGGTQCPEGTYCASRDPDTCCDTQDPDACFPL
jgi:hypothetical protein